MTTWPPRIEPDEDLRAADSLLGKADALLRRHRTTDPATPLPHEAEEVISLDDDDLPLLTEVVDPAEIPRSEPPSPALQPPAPQASPAEPPPTRPVSELAEQLISLDTEIARAVEAWFATELPQLLHRELDRLSARLQEEASAHLRATLLPTLSEHISRSLEKNIRLDPED